MYSRKKRLSLWSTLLVLFLSVLLSMTARTSRVLDVVHSADPESVFSFVGQTRQNVLEAYPQCQESEPWSTILSEKGYACLCIEDVPYVDFPNNFFRGWNILPEYYLPEIRNIISLLIPV